MGRLFNFSSSCRLWRFLGNCKEGDSCWLQYQNVCGNNTLSLMDLGFGYGGSVMGFCGPGIYHVTGETMGPMLRIGGGW